LIGLVVFAVLGASPAEAAASVWASAPKPKFPAAALSRGQEGYVMVRAYIGQDGRVSHATISKSSGDATLDNAARTAVLKWKMNPSAIKPEYLTKGYALRIDFRQEAPVAASYRNRDAYFNSFADAKLWTYAPFPDYPYHERYVKAEGTAFVIITTGRDGQAVSAEIARSSGNANLDKAALSALRLWRARKEYAGSKFLVPVRFILRPFRR
jgi:TonB family protein